MECLTYLDIQNAIHVLDRSLYIFFIAGVFLGVVSTFFFSSLIGQRTDRSASHDH